MDKQVQEQSHVGTIGPEKKNNLETTKQLFISRAAALLYWSSEKTKKHPDKHVLRRSFIDHRKKKQKKLWLLRKKL